MHRFLCGLVFATTLVAQATSRLELGEGVTLELVAVPAGTFRQTAAGEVEREVTISRAFRIGRTEVTRAHFARFVAETGYRTEAERGASGGLGWNGKELEQKKAFTWRSPGFVQTDAHPVCLVTWDDAVAFCTWLTKRSGQLVQLPTEAQWEYACRAGTATTYHGGDGEDQLAKLAWYARNAEHTTHPVGQKDANALGIHDLAGNVFEWCQDWFAPYGAGPVTDPVATIPGGDKPRRVLRGGSWRHDAKNCASGARWRSDPASRSADNGFRVVVGADATGAPESRPATGPRAKKGGPRAEGVVLGFVSDPFTTGLWIVAGALIVGFAVQVILAMRGLLGQGGPARVEKTKDGFWIHVPTRASPMLVTVRYRMPGGSWSQQRVTVDGTHFVYTGQPPVEIRIVNARRNRSGDVVDVGMAAGDDAGDSDSTAMSLASEDTRSESAPSSPSSWSAY